MSHRYTWSPWSGEILGVGPVPSERKSEGEEKRASRCGDALRRRSSSSPPTTHVYIYFPPRTPLLLINSLGFNYQQSIHISHTSTPISSCRILTSLLQWTPPPQSANSAKDKSPDGQQMPTRCNSQNLLTTATIFQERYDKSLLFQPKLN
jgi:hypothetical protein